MNFSPRIVSAAMLMNDGLVVPGVRHFSPDMRAVLKRIYGFGYHLRVKEQGFINSAGEFLGREAALQIALLHGQRINRVGGDDRRLDSSCLY